MKPGYLKIEELACIIGVSSQTLNIWYKWKRYFPDSPNASLLPDYVQEGPHKTRYWKRDDVWKLIEFKNSVVRGRGGNMGDITQRRIKSRKENKNGKKENHH